MTNMSYHSPVYSFEDTSRIPSGSQHESLISQFNSAKSSAREGRSSSLPGRNLDFMLSGRRNTLAVPVHGLSGQYFTTSQSVSCV